jgi:3-dehydroquinate synthase
LLRLRIRTQPTSSDYEISIGHGLLSRVGEFARHALGKPARRIAIISNSKVFSLYGTVVVASLKRAGFQISNLSIGDGERFKSLRTTEKALNLLIQERFSRDDCVVALGGGVVGDVAGFAASIYMRGIPFIQVPTTLLAQVDSSVGGKTGVNLPEGKNLVGTFHQPRAVIIDTTTLSTLPLRELSSGWFETIKQGAVGGRKLFKETARFLNKFETSSNFQSPDLAALIHSHLTFKGSIVAADERESVARNDHRSRKILNFGHTIAHALETVTKYKRFRHGEAVGHGMLVAGAISKNLGLLEPSELELLHDGVRLCGPLPSARDLRAVELINCIARDKKQVLGHVRWVLLEKIGRPRIVDGKEIPRSLINQSLSEALGTKH